MIGPNYTIIIPHYNIPELLIRCIKSIPIRKDIQVIVVDDCSPGGDKYLEKYGELSRPYLEYYSTPKGGSAGRARNIGLENARGKWLIFVDADDLFTEDAIMFFDSYCNSENDIIFFNHKCVMNDDLTIQSKRDSYDWMFESYKQTGDEYLFRCEYPAPWGKMIRRSHVVNCNARFSETRWSNDHVFSIIVGLNAKSIKVDEHSIYMLTEREGSLTNEKQKTDKEWQVRYAVAKEVQTLVDHSKYRGHITQLYSYIMQFLKNDKKRFVKEFIKLSNHPYWQYLIIKKVIENNIKK